MIVYFCVICFIIIFVINIFVIIISIIIIIIIIVITIISFILIYSIYVRLYETLVKYRTGIFFLYLERLDRAKMQSSGVSLRCFVVQPVYS